MSHDTVPQRSEAVVSREVDGEIYLASSDGERMFTLSEVGADIWRACDGKRSFGQIVDQLLDIYDVDRKTLERDLEDFLNLLRERDLVRWE